MGMRRFCHGHAPPVGSVAGKLLRCVVPMDKHVTTQQAADVLNVSRQYLVRLLEEDRIPFRKTGKHRRLRIEDVLAFKDKRDKDRAAGLRDLSRLTQELGGYDAEPK